MSKSQLQILQEFFSSNQQQTLDIRERDEGKVLSVLQTLTSDSAWEDGYKSIQEIRAGVVSTFDENEKEWKGRRVGSALRLLNLRESRISHGLTQYLIKKARVDNLVNRFRLNPSEPELPTSEINSTISPISTRHAQNHEQRVEMVSKVDQILATDKNGTGRDGEQGEHLAQTASLPFSTRSTRKTPSIDERFENPELLHPHVKRGFRAPVEPDDDPQPLTAKEHSNGEIRIDSKLLQEHILKTIIPAEMNQVGYAHTSKIEYAATERFGNDVKPLVRETLAELQKRGKIERPFRDCWRLTKC